VDFRFFSTKQEIDALTGEMTGNQTLLEEYIRFQGALIELGKVGNAFTAQAWVFRDGCEVEVQAQEELKAA